VSELAESDILPVAGCDVSESSPAALGARKDPPPVATIVDLSKRSFAMIRRNFEMYISESIQGTWDNWLAFGGPALIDRLTQMENGHSDELGLLNMILVIAGELVVRGPETFGVLIRDSLNNVCMNERLDRLLNTDDERLLNVRARRDAPGVASFKYVLQNFPRANLLSICENIGIRGIRIALLDRLYRDIVMDGKVWTPSVSLIWDSSSPTRGLEIGLAQILSAKREYLVRGPIYQDDAIGDAHLARRLWFTRLSRAGRSFFQVGDGPYSTRHYYAIGVFMGLCILENQPVGIEFDDEWLNGLRGLAPSGIPRVFTALGRGFKSVIDTSTLNSLVPRNEDLRRIFYGEQIVGSEFFEFIFDGEILPESVDAEMEVESVVNSRQKYVSCIAEKAAGFMALPAGVTGTIRTCIQVVSDLVGSIADGYLRIPATAFTGSKEENEEAIRQYFESVCRDDL
jgi:hypothetical protein